ncbi:MAG: NFACT family protein [bacterium]|nr:NFACT family protein [bacterium]
MAFDGITIANLTAELDEALRGGRIYKIVQPEKDELLLTIKNHGTQYRLLMSANASLPLLYLTQKNKQAPMTAPNFCMLLRKHLQNARIVQIEQPDFERIVVFSLEHLDELGDLCRKRLVIELMGKHSNIIFVDDNDCMIDSIKHISGMVSSVREVLPGRAYYVPKTQEKQNPLTADASQVKETLAARPMPAFQAVYTSFTGLSPVIAQEICHRAGVDADRAANTLPDEALTVLAQAFVQVMRRVEQKAFTPNIIYEGAEPREYAAFPLTLYDGARTATYEQMSALLEDYYAQKSAVTRIRQKSADLRKIVQTAYERNLKKYDLQCRQLADTEKREKYKVYGELLNTYGYSAPDGAKSLDALNYYTNEMITIPLDPAMSAGENAKKYFERYGKLKRTNEALLALTKETKAEIDQLESVMMALDMARGEEDLTEIREELVESGYIRRKGGAKRARTVSKPFHYVSSDGFHMYVGKNNYQNEELTFQMAAGGDWWFHAKGIPGSHVIVKTQGEELPDRTYEEAAALAAHYSKGADQDKVEIDYTLRRNVKKPNGAKPGFVVYYTNYSMAIAPDITGIEELDS